MNAPWLLPLLLAVPALPQGPSPAVFDAAALDALFDGTRSFGPAAVVDTGDVSRVAIMARRTLARNSQQRTVPRLGAKPWLLLAGRNQFAALWTRDFCFAALGALASTGSKEAVRGSLEALLAYQREDGLLPRRLAANKNYIQHAKAAIGWPFGGGTFNLPEYATAGKAESIDDNALAVWIAAEYVRRTGDRAFARRHRDGLIAAVAWLDARAPNGLLVQAPEADWMDMTYRRGVVAYSNVLYVQALRSLAELTGDDSYRRRADETARRLVAALWDEERGRLKDTVLDDRFSADGNLLAVWLGVLSPERSAQVLDQAKLLLRRPNGLYACADPPYPKGMYPSYLALNGMEGYGSNAFVYPWITSLFALAADSQDRGQDARDALEALARATTRDGGFREFLEPDGDRPVSRPFEDAESDFAWSAGLFLKAVEERRSR